MLDRVKLALRITTTAFDTELNDLIDAAYEDLGVAGVINTENETPLIIRAVITYCRCNFGQPDNYDELKKSYDEQKAQLSMNSDYTDWGDCVG